MSQEPQLTIGRLAKAAGVGVQTVRFYERRGLLSRPARQGGTYRRYDADHVTRIRFIKRAQQLGFSLREIDSFLTLNASSRATCADVKARTDRKLAEIDAKLQDLERMKKSLQRLSKACGAGQDAMARCRVLDCFQDDRFC